MQNYIEDLLINQIQQYKSDFRLHFATIFFDFLLFLSLDPLHEQIETKKNKRNKIKWGFTQS